MIPKNLHTFLIYLCTYVVLIAKLLGVTKHTTAEELHQLVMAKKTTYMSIKRIDPIKFSDLESTMRMLYDHGKMQAEEAS